jgi:hypothetical protein
MDFFRICCRRRFERSPRKSRRNRKARGLFFVLLIPGM